MTHVDIPGLTDVELKTITSILRPARKVLLFGSRVKGTHRRYSDLDVAVKLPAGDHDILMSQLREQFQTSDLPFKVDVVNIDEVSKDFLQLIESTSVCLWNENHRDI